MKGTRSCQRGLQKNPITGKCDLPKVEHWILNTQRRIPNHFEFNHEDTETELKVFRPVDGKDWAVSIRRPHSLFEYLAGGNSEKHDASRAEAMELAKAYMLLHPHGRKDY
ncbi:MAG: hypothetical protein IMZ52_10685 [Actinobacteria bacterium]|nr:hypothetical protein [Bacteroidota bacterium]MBE3095486.1 hypothetical protein [Actinomycetota bacterium]